MNTVNKLVQKLAFFLVVFLFVACDNQDDITEIRGKIYDVENSKAVSGVQVDLVIGEGIDSNYEMINPVRISVTSNSQGDFAHIFEANRNQSVFQVIINSDNYKEIEECGGIHTKQLYQGKRNLNNLDVAYVSEDQQLANKILF